MDSIQEDKSTPLHFACAQGSVDMVRLMYELQPERFDKAMKSTDVLKMTPIHRAALFDHVAVVEFLIKLVNISESYPLISYTLYIKCKNGKNSCIHMKTQMRFWNILC